MYEADAVNCPSLLSLPDGHHSPSPPRTDANKDSNGSLSGGSAARRRPNAGDQSQSGRRDKGSTSLSSASSDAMCMKNSPDNNDTAHSTSTLLRHVVSSTMVPCEIYEALCGRAGVRPSRFLLRYLREEVSLAPAIMAANFWDDVIAESKRRGKGGQRRVQAQVSDSSGLTYRPTPPSTRPVAGAPADVTYDSSAEDEERSYPRQVEIAAPSQRAHVYYKQRALLASGREPHRFRYHAALCGSAAAMAASSSSSSSVGRATEETIEHSAADGNGMRCSRDGASRLPAFELDLSGDYVGPVGALAVLSLCLHMPFITRIDLRGNGIDNHTISYLVSDLDGAVPWLRSLDLSFNYLLTATSGAALLPFVQNNENIEECCASEGTNIPLAVSAAIESICAARRIQGSGVLSGAYDIPSSEENAYSYSFGHGDMVCIRGGLNLAKNERFARVMERYRNITGNNERCGTYDAGVKDKGEEAEKSEEDCVVYSTLAKLRFYRTRLCYEDRVLDCEVNSSYSSKKGEQLHRFSNTRGLSRDLAHQRTAVRRVRTAPSSELNNSTAKGNTTTGQSPSRCFGDLPSLSPYSYSFIPKESRGREGSRQCDPSSSSGSEVDLQLQKNSASGVIEGDEVHLEGEHCMHFGQEPRRKGLPSGLANLYLAAGFVHARDFVAMQKTEQQKKDLSDQKGFTPCATEISDVCLEATDARRGRGRDGFPNLALLLDVVTEGPSFCNSNVSDV